MSGEGELESVFAAPEHEWSSYDRGGEGGVGWAPAMELCAGEIAEDLLARAESYPTAGRFLKAWGSDNVGFDQTVGTARR